MKFRSIQLWITIVVLVLAPFVFGSVELFWVVVWTILLSAGVFAGAGMPMTRAQSRIVALFLVVCGVYLLVAIAQVVPNLVGQADDPSWTRANQLLNLNLSPRVSSRGEIPPTAAGHLLLLVTAFVCGFTIGTSRSGATRLFWVAQHAILFYAIYGIAALIFAPDTVLWASKVAYLGSLTSTFINHNTAAAFIGAGTIMWLCAAVSSLQSIRFVSFRLLLLTPSNERLVWNVVVRLTATLVCFFALLLTRSRGGLICSCLGMFVAILLMLFNRERRNWPIFVGGGLLLVVAGEALSHIGRIGSDGLFDDARWSVYGFCLQSIRERPLLGTGIGTFADIFPSLRSENFYSWGVWDYAHSTVLEIAVEMGIPVASMVVLVAIASVFILVRGAVRSRDRGRRLLAAVAGIATLGYLHSLIDFSLQIPGFLIVFAILLGCGLAQATASPAELDAAENVGDFALNANPG